ncbi:MAG TPA: glycoside hydrolase domain-containing protein [Streptosporangiaceae bacterium]|nr:glycoside hydrolase domain-containing protein [Streptosporangiaceae bacterium]
MNIVVADYAFSHPTIAQLQAAGVGAVGRYFGQDATNDGKDLTAAEAKLLSDAGISIFTIFEYGASQATGGAAQAARDVEVARAQRREVGMPDGRPVYFAVDFDIPDYAPAVKDPLAKLGPVGEYFQALHAEMGPNVGVYGGYWAVSRVLNAGLASWAFQTVAWSGGQWDPRACLRQGGQTALGGAVDLDTPERADFGQWKVGASPPPPAQTDGYLVIAGATGGFAGRAVTSADGGKTWS